MRVFRVVFFGRMIDFFVGIFGVGSIGEFRLGSELREFWFG